MSKGIVVLTFLILAILVLSTTATQDDLMAVQSKNQSEEKMILMKEENNQDLFFCEAFCKPFLEDGQGNGIYSKPEGNKRCMSQCVMSMIRKKMMMTNEEECETSCRIIQEKPLTVECIRVCHGKSPGGAVVSS